MASLRPQTGHYAGQPTCRQRLVFVGNGRRVTYCSPSCTSPLTHLFTTSGSPTGLCTRRSFFACAGVSATTRSPVTKLSHSLNPVSPKSWDSTSITAPSHMRYLPRGKRLDCPWRSLAGLLSNSPPSAVEDLGHSRDPISKRPYASRPAEIRLSSGCAEISTS